MDLSFLLMRLQENCSRALKSFNPCSYGSFVLTKSDAVMVNDDDKFQSLFLWIFRSYWSTNKNRKGHRPGGFNPCSYGSFVLT